MKDDKRDLRREILARIDRLPEDYIQSSNRGIYRNIVSLPEFLEASTIFAYCSMDREPDTAGIIRKAFDLGKQVLLPACLGGGVMEARMIRSLSELGPGRFGIPEPSAVVGVPPDQVDLILVPAVTFDREGFRLGRGGGYYDRYLSGTKAYTVGLAREKLLFDVLPREEHDIPVNCIVTETAIARLR
jgi:5-formyltetrahydrofolate cyclo-ligase